MNAKERGFLLLTSRLGDPTRKPLTVAQFRTLANRVRTMERPVHPRELTGEDLVALGYDRETAWQILRLLQQEDLLDWYVKQGLRHNCIPITRVSDAYPPAVRQRLGLDAPGCLWAKGNVALLSTQMIALVGSRDLREENRAFAESVGTEAAKQGITLVSGNARGADRVAQQACLDAGGNVISVVADELKREPVSERILYLSEEGFDLPFSGPRALSRNRVIHALGYLTLVAQSDLGMGGTWDGTIKNLRQRISPVFCFNDESPASKELEQMGATLVIPQQLSDLAALREKMDKFC